eukprot:Gb_13945 [translate_table: standard]
MTKQTHTDRVATGIKHMAKKKVWVCLFGERKETVTAYNKDYSNETKGTLPEGREIPVKRLFYNTGQDVREFLNKVNLISGIQHKNLVKLLGCSVKGPERLLVYEYLANKSLDRFLFDATKNRLLDWGSRFDIILGIAMGLAYLHEGSEIRIIHRDIKPSNVLLDQNLKPKIADFGLARYFAADRSHLSMELQEHCYMAPKYVVRGQLTEKADIFSFGVLVLKILSEKRNSNFVPAEATQSLLAVIWNHYQAEKVADIIDPNCNMEEALCVVQVALLCTQASATLCPSMSKVVQMLKNKEQKLPVPRQSPFVELQAASDQSLFASHLPNLIRFGNGYGQYPIVIAKGIQLSGARAGTGTGAGAWEQAQELPGREEQFAAPSATIIHSFKQVCDVMKSVIHNSLQQH